MPAFRHAAKLKRARLIPEEREVPSEVALHKPHRIGTDDRKIILGQRLNLEKKGTEKGDKGQKKGTGIFSWIGTEKGGQKKGTGIFSWIGKRGQASFHG